MRILDILLVKIGLRLSVEGGNVLAWCKYKVVSPASFVDPFFIPANLVDFLRLPMTHPMY